MPNEKHICCLCGKDFNGWGNNPWPCDPIYDKDNDDPVCCDECNMNKVIVARIMKMRNRES